MFSRCMSLLKRKRQLGTCLNKLSTGQQCLNAGITSPHQDNDIFSMEESLGDCPLNHHIVPNIIQQPESEQPEMFLVLAGLFILVCLFHLICLYTDQWSRGPARSLLPLKTPSSTCVTSQVQHLEQLVISYCQGPQQVEARRGEPNNPLSPSMYQLLRLHPVWCEWAAHVRSQGRSCQLSYTPAVERGVSGQSFWCIFTESFQTFTGIFLLL